MTPIRQSKLYSNKHYLFLASAILFIGVVTFTIPISFDNASYYFKYAQEISKAGSGLLYHDIEFNYSPLPVYLYALVFKLNSGLPANSMLLLVNVIFLLGTAYCIFRISSFFKVNQTLSISFISLFLITSVAIDFSTEYYVVFFEVLMLWLLLKGNKLTFLLAGVCAFLAFYSKQYGIIAVFIGGFYFLFFYRKWSNVMYYFLGLLLPILVISIYYSIVTNNFGVFNFLAKLLFPNNGEKALTGESYSISGLIKSFSQFLLLAPYFLIAVYLFITQLKSFTKEFTYVTSLLLVSFAPLLIAYYLHYFLLVIPFVIIFTMVVFDRFLSLGSFKYLKAIVVLCISFSLLTSTASLIRIKKAGSQFVSTRQPGINPDKLMKNDCNELNKIIPAGSKVYIVDCVYYYYYADFYSIDLKNLGYTWGQQHGPEYVFNFFTKGDYMLVRDRSRFDEFKTYFQNQQLKDKSIKQFKWLGYFPNNKPTEFLIFYKSE